MATLCDRRGQGQSCGWRGRRGGQTLLPPGLGSSPRGHLGSLLCSELAWDPSDVASWKLAISKASLRQEETDRQTQTDGLPRRITVSSGVSLGG